MSQNMNRSQHASTDYHDKKSGCFQQLFLSTPLTGRVTTTTLCELSYTCLAPRLATCNPSHRGCFPNASSKVVQPGAPAFHVRDRHRVHRLLLARLHDPASSVKARPPGLEPKRRLTNNSAAAASSVSARCPRNTLLNKSSTNSLVGKPHRHNATRSLSRKVASALAKLHTPIRSRWHSRRLRTSVKTLALSSGGVPTPTAVCPSSQHHQCEHQNHAFHDQQRDLVCMAHRRHARASKWLASTLVIKGATTRPSYTVALKVSTTALQPEPPPSASSSGPPRCHPWEQPSAGTPLSAHVNRLTMFSFYFTFHVLSFIFHVWLYSPNLLTSHRMVLRASCEKFFCVLCIGLRVQASQVQNVWPRQAAGTGGLQLPGGLPPTARP